MVDMLYYNVFGAEIINAEAEGDGMSGVPSQYGNQVARGVAMRCKKVLYLFVGKSTCFGKAISDFATLNVYVALMHDVHQILLLNNFLWDKIDRGADISVIFRILKQCPQIVIFNVHSHETGSWRGNCTIQQNCASCSLLGDRHKEGRSRGTGYDLTSLKHQNGEGWIAVDVVLNFGI